MCRTHPHVRFSRQVLATLAHSYSRRRFLGTAAGTASAVAVPGMVTGCGIAPLDTDPTVVRWSTWGNPGEIGRMQEFTDDFNRRHADAGADLRARLIPVPSDNYQPRLLTQLGGGTATDAFYAYDYLISQLINADLISPLRERMESADSRAAPEEFVEQLWGTARTADGEIYGVSVDCNPICMWYNAQILADSGISEPPAETFERGGWTMDAFQDIADAVHRSGRRVAAIGDDWQAIYSWITAGGGAVYADGRFVAHEDPTSVETVSWLAEQVASGAFLYAGGMPEGQGQEALFMSNNLAFAISLGRWVLPLFRENENLDFDIVPYPTPDGSLASSPVAVAYIAMNRQATDPDRTFAFLSEFVSAQGQTFRLQGEGNAVPSIEGSDEVVLEDDRPAHAQYFLDIRENGYPLPQEEAEIPGLGSEIEKRFGKLFAENQDPKQTLDDVGQVVNEAIERGTLV